MGIAAAGVLLVELLLFRTPSTGAALGDGALIALIMIVAAAVAATGLMLHLVVVRRLRRLVRAVARVSGGDLSVRFPEGRAGPSRDELRDLARHLDNMIRAVAARGTQHAAVTELARHGLEGASTLELTDHACRLLRDGLRTEHAEVLELALSGDELLLVSGVGWREGLVGRARVDLNGHAGFALRTDGSAISNDLLTEKRFQPAPMLREHGIRSSVSVVVPGRGAPYGVLGAHSARPRAFTRDDVIFLTAMANALGAAIAQRGVHLELRDAEAKYRDLVERLPAITYIAEFGTGGTWHYVSPQIQSILGYAPEEWMARPGLWYERLHPDDRERALGAESPSRGSGEPYSCEYRMIARDGRVVWFRDDAVVLRDDEGSPVALQGVMYDTSESREAEEATRELQARYRNLVEQVPAAVYIEAIDDAGTVIYMSPQFEELTGHPAPAVVTNPQVWTDSIHPDDRDQVVSESHRTNETLEPFRLDYRMIHRDGSTVWVRDEAQVLRDDSGKALYWQGVLVDVTRHKSLEEGLREAYDREREAAEGLRTLDEMKNAFLAAVSHELRTPLSAVLGYALTLERPEIVLEERERRELTGRIAVNARKLERLLSDLLDLDRLARGVLEPHRRPADLARLAEGVVADLDLAGRRIEMSVEPMIAQVDAPKVERILENLLANALKHTPPDSAVWVTIEERDNGVLVTVEDEGSGIPDELKDAVFQPFNRGADGERSVVAGTGIGLSLVARFAELHGGSTWVEDRPERGSAFRVYLPCDVAPSTEAARAAVGR